MDLARMEEIPEELIERLVDEVALTGTFGFGEDRFREAVTSFYNERKQKQQQQDVASATGLPPELHDGSLVTVDEDLSAKVRQQLEQHRDIHVKTDDDGIRLADVDGEDPTTKSRHTGRVLIATSEHIRRTLSHESKSKFEQMGGLVFDCLSVIAAYGPAGILQSDLRRVTGQQKQSVPGRTDRLAKRGYITKRTVLAHGTKTSLLTLKRWAGSNEVVQPVHAQGTISNHPSGRTIIDYDLWFAGTMDLLKAQPNHLIAIEDLKIGLDIHKKKFETRALMRCIRRMSHVGVFRTISAKPADEDGRTAGKAIRCIQLLRDPTDGDRVTWRTRTAKGKRYSNFGIVDESSAEDGAAASDDDDEDSEEDRDTVLPNNSDDEDTEDEAVEEAACNEVDVRNDAVNQDAVELDENPSPVGKRKRTAPRRYDPESDHDAGRLNSDDDVPTRKRKRLPTSRFNYDMTTALFDRQEVDNGRQNDDMNELLMEELREAAEQPRKKRKYTKRQHNGPKLPIVRTRPRITSEKSNPKFEAWAKRTAEKLTKIQVWAEKEAAKLEREQQGDQQQEAQPPEDAGPDPHRAEEEAEAVKLRTAQLEEELLARSRNGVYINPPGALDLKGSTVYQRGRPRNACIAVIKSGRLGQLDLANTPKVDAIAREKMALLYDGLPPVSVRANETPAEEFMASSAGHIDDNETQPSMASPRETTNESLSAEGMQALEPALQPPNNQDTASELQQRHHLPATTSAVPASESWTADAAIPSANTTFTKEYTEQHPNEEFHHCGNGRYKRGPKPSKTRLDSTGRTGSQSSATSTRRPSTNAGNHRASLDQSAIDDSRALDQSPTPSVVQDSHAYEKTAAKTAAAKTSTLAMAPPSTTHGDSRPQRTKALPNRYSEYVLDLETALDTPLPLPPASRPHSRLFSQTTTPPTTGAHTPASAIMMPSLSDLARSSPVAALAELRKKRGRPTSAIIAEKQRLQNEIDALPPAERERMEKEVGSLPKSKPSVIAKLSIPALKETGMDELLKQASIKRSLQASPTARQAVNNSSASAPDPGVVSESLLSTVESKLPAVQGVSPTAARPTPFIPANSPLTIVRPYHTPIKAPFTSTEATALPSAAVPDVDNERSENEPEEDAMEVDFPEPLDNDRAADGDSDFQPDAEEAEAEEGEAADDAGVETDTSEPGDDRDFGYARRKSRSKYGVMERQRFSNDDKKRQQRATIILDLLEQCGGVFPGNGEIFFPFCREWHKMHEVTPDRRTVNAAVQRLVEDGKLKRVPFSFRDDEGDIQDRSVLTFASIDSTSVLIEEVKEAMIRAWPSRYLPEEIGGQEAEDEGRRIESGKTGVAQHGASKNEFPVMEGLTVQRTPQAISIADAAAQAKGSANARSRRLQQMRAGARRQYDKRKKQANLFGGAREVADLDTDSEQNGRPRTGSMRERTARRALMKLLMSASQSFYPTSGTFGTDTPDLTFMQARTQRLPQSLDDILRRVELMGYPQEVDSSSGIDEFSSIVDRIYAWESDVRDREVFLTDNVVWQFVNLTIAETHITAPREPNAVEITLDKPNEYDSPEGFVTKEYKMAHPEEAIYHVGAGRYRRGIKPADYVRGKRPGPTTKKQKRSYINTGVPCFPKVYVDAHPNEEFHEISGGLYRRGPRPANYNDPKLARLPKEPYFSKEYKDTHPDEELYHIGGGRYRRGKMPDGYRDSRKNGPSARYERERGQNYGWTYHKSVKSSQRKALDVTRNQGHDLHPVEAVEYSIPDCYEREQSEGANGNASPDAAFVDDDDAEAVIDDQDDEQPILNSTRVASPRSQAAGLLTSDRKALVKAFKQGRVTFKHGSEKYDKQYKDAHPDDQLIHVGAGRWRKIADIAEVAAAVPEPPARGRTATEAEDTTSATIMDVSGLNDEPHQDQVNEASATAVPWHAMPAPAGADDRSTRKYRSRKKTDAGDIEIVDIPGDADDDFEPDDEARDEATRPIKKARLTNGQPAPKRRPGGRPRVRGFPHAEDLLLSVAIVRVLCGGLYQTSIKWELVAHAMSFRYEPDYLSARWNPVRVANQGRVENLQDSLREPFLEAYEKGELPSINFQHPENTDWPAVLEWVKRIDPRCSAPSTQKMQVAENQVIELPQSVDGLVDDFTISAHAAATEPDIEQHFRAVSGEQRGVLALRYIEGVPLQNELIADSIAPLEVLKSWCRAVSVAKPEHYNGQAATRKISNNFSEAMIKRAVDELQADSTLTLEKGGHQVPGRNFRLHNTFLKQFRRWPDEEFQYLRDVAAARERIITHFDTNDTLELSMHTNDPEIVVLTNMVSQGHLKVTSALPELNNDIDAPMPRLSVWGIDGIQTIYDSKNVNPARLRFPLVYQWTPKFTHEHGLQQVPVPLINLLRDGTQDPRIPFWVDIHGNLVDEVWDMVMRSVLWLLVFRPGSTADAISKAHDKKLGVYEIEMLLDWMEQTGLAQRFGAGKEVDGAWKGGWRASEWWYCACASDVAPWEAPVSELR